MRCWKQLADVDDSMGVAPRLKSPMWCLAEGWRRCLSRHVERLRVGGWSKAECVWINTDMDCRLSLLELTLALPKTQLGLAEFVRARLPTL